MLRRSGLNSGGGQDIPSSLWEVTFNVSLGNTQHSQSLVSKARDNSDKHYNTVKKQEQIQSPLFFSTGIKLVV